MANEGEKAAAAADRIEPIPLDRPGYPKDVPTAVPFLASERIGQAGYVTGETTYVDGDRQVFRSP